MPTVNNSFDYSETSLNEIFLYQDNFGLKYRASNFELDLIRLVQPKNISLTADSKYTEIFYVYDDDRAVSISFKDQKADTQKIDCYTFSSLTIGYCNEAMITISNTKDRYKPLNNETLMLIDAMNEEFQFKYYKTSEFILFDQYILYAGVSKNKFNWLSPIEELTTGFISNLTFKGSTIGELVSNEIQRLPQRDEFFLYKLGVNYTKTINVYSFIDFFYDVDLLFVETKEYIPVSNINNYNIKLKTGLSLNFNESLAMTISGSLYKNNLYGFEDISFNQRSEHHFAKSYGTIDASLKYLF